MLDDLHKSAWVTERSLYTRFDGHKHMEMMGAYLRGVEDSREALIGAVQVGSPAWPEDSEVIAVARARRARQHKPVEVSVVRSALPRAFAWLLLLGVLALWVMPMVTLAVLKYRGVI